MKNIYATVFILVSSLSIQAQYYYKDIIGTQEVNQTIKLYLTNNVLSAEATGFDGDGVKDNDFSETHNFFADRTLLKISTRNKTNIANEYYRFNLKELLASVSNTSSSVISTTSYSYDDKNNPIIIKNVATDKNDSIYVN